MTSQTADPLAGTWVSPDGRVRYEPLAPLDVAAQRAAGNRTFEHVSVIGELWVGFSTAPGRPPRRELLCRRAMHLLDLRLLDGDAATDVRVTYAPAGDESRYGASTWMSGGDPIVVDGPLTALGPWHSVGEIIRGTYVDPWRGTRTPMLVTADGLVTDGWRPA